MPEESGGRRNCAGGHRGGRLRETDFLPVHRAGDRGGLRRAASENRETRERKRTAREPDFLSRAAAESFSAGDRRAGKSRNEREPGLDAAGDREAVRARPEIRARTEPGGARKFRRGTDLPDRPLPGKRDGAESDGLPVREFAVRAAVESRPRGERRDYRGGIAGSGTPGALLRGSWRAARHDSEPPDTTDDDSGDGSAGGVRSGADPARESKGAAVGEADTRRGRRSRTVRGGENRRQTSARIPGGAGNRAE